MTKSQIEAFRVVRASIDNSTIAIESGAGDDGEDGIRMTPATHSMRSTREDLKRPFNKLTNSIFKAMTASTTMGDLKKQAAIGMNALRAVRKMFSESSASVGESAERLRPIGEGKGKQRTKRSKK